MMKTIVTTAAILMALLTFTFKRKYEEGDLNCLEVPAGRFDYTIRYDLPKDPIRSGKWRMSKAVLQKN